MSQTDGLPASRPQVPRHVGVSMDGNGRWAKLRGLPRTAGHLAGERPLLEFIRAALAHGIGYLSVHAFTPENWNRPPAEVNFLLDFVTAVMARNRAEFVSTGVRVLWLGRRDHVPHYVIEALAEVEAATAGNTALTMAFCANYGGQQEIVDAARRLARDAADGLVDPQAVNLEGFRRYLYAPALPDIDLFIRSSGEHRISNFQLWQTAYAELYFTDTLWPDMRAQHFADAVEWYATRQRRFGRLPR